MAQPDLLALLSEDFGVIHIPWIKLTMGRQRAEKSSVGLANLSFAHKTGFVEHFYDQAFIDGEGKDHWESQYIKELVSLKYDVYDVKGDGSCGFWALLMGGLNIGMEKTTQKRSYRNVMNKLRESMYNFILQEIDNGLVKRYRNKAWWYHFGAFSDDEAVDATSCLQSLDSTEFQKSVCDESLQMDCLWGPFTYALMKKVRVVCIICAKGDQWSTNIFDQRHTGDIHVTIGIPGIFRVKTLNRTIEILYETSAGDATDKQYDNHFSFLFRFFQMKQRNIVILNYITSNQEPGSGMKPSMQG